MQREIVNDFIKRSLIKVDCGSFFLYPLTMLSMKLIYMFKEEAGGKKQEERERRYDDHAKPAAACPERFR